MYDAPLFEGQRKKKKKKNEQNKKWARQEQGSQALTKYNGDFPENRE